MDGSLVLRGLTVRFAGRAAVCEVSFQAATPGWWGVLGANGSGKTTLLRALSGRLAHQAGDIWVNGEDLTDDPARRARTIGYAPPLDTLPIALTAAELLTLVGRARGARAESPSHLYEALDLRQLADRRIGAMSSGMRQRLALFVAFLGQPSIVLLDEPFNWLDPVAAYDAKVCLAELASTTVLVSALHDVSTFATRCCGGVLMQEGRIARTFEAADLQKARGDLPGFEREIYESLRSRQP